MSNYQFKKIFGWIAWITLLVAGAWAGLIVIDFIDWGTRNVGILSIFLGIGILTFAVDSMMEQNPEFMKNYFIQWLLVCGLFLFFGLSIWAWFPTG